jgi:hypothetical protein
MTGVCCTRSSEIFAEMQSTSISLEHKVTRDAYRNAVLLVLTHPSDLERTARRRCDSADETTGARLESH